MPENTDFSQNSNSNSATILLPSEWSANLDSADSTTSLTVRTPDKNHRSAREIELTFPAQIFLSGNLPKNRSIVNLPILVELEDGDFIVSEQQFYNHAARDNFNDAILAFARNLSDAYDSLLEEETNLGEHLQEELEFFRKTIITNE